MGHRRARRRSARAEAPPSCSIRCSSGRCEATTLEAVDATGLTEWLDTNGYAIRDEIAALLDEYVEKGWYFVALKLTSDVPLDGGLDPIRFTFDSDELVYPMALSKAATDAAAGAALRLPGSPGPRRRLDDPAATCRTARRSGRGRLRMG